MITAYLYHPSDIFRDGVPRTLAIGMPGGSERLIGAVAAAYNDVDVAIFDHSGACLAEETYWRARETPSQFVLRLLELAAAAKTAFLTEE